MIDTSIGVDIEKISKFEYLLSQKGFYNLNRIFLNSELEYAIAEGNAASHLAACFCMKEATIKALSQFGVCGIGLHQVEVLHNDSGMPEINIIGLSNQYKVSVSTSHSGGMAIASTLVTKYDKI